MKLEDIFYRNRKWISYDIETRSLYCSICMAFLITFGQDSKLFTGYLACIKKHESLYQEIERHEKSKTH